MMRRAVECIREGRVRDVRTEMKGAGVIRYSCRIKGQTGSVYRTWLEEEDSQLTNGFCTCPAYQRTEYVCKHIIALALEVWNEFNAAQKNHGGLDILAAIRELEKETEQLRCKALEESGADAMSCLLMSFCAAARCCMRRSWGRKNRISAFCPSLRLKWAAWIWS